MKHPASDSRRRLYLKDETGNPSASLKDRASAVALCRAIDIGARVVSTASTGNAGSSLACLAAALGMQAVVFVPANAPSAKLTQLLSYGAKVLAVQGSYDEAYDLCLAASDEFGWFNRSTGFNPFTREGKKTCSFEIWGGLDGEVPRQHSERYLEGLAGFASSRPDSAVTENRLRAVRIQCRHRGYGAKAAPPA
jgi:threonine synthase